MTGNYVVGSVDLAPQSAAQGFVTGTIPMGGVPADADVLAAFLYWETISTADPQVNGATFRGLPLVAVKTSSAVLNPTTAPCWSSGWRSPVAAHTMTMFRADVLRLLPDRLDANGRPTGKKLVNDADLLSSGVALHTVTLPEAGTGSAGTVQRWCDARRRLPRSRPQPLTQIVLYDGIHIQPTGRDDVADDPRVLPVVTKRAAG